MTGKGHNWSGVSLIPSVYYETFSSFQNHIVSIIACLFLISGATAPDWLEIRKKTGGTVITHRTITHWVPLWIALLCFSIFMMKNTIILYELSFLNYNIPINEYVAASLLGFSLGGLLHLVVDFPNPMGIPVFTPTHRLSLNLWKSGKKESLILTIIFMLSFFHIGIDSGVVEINTSKIAQYIDKVS